VARDQAKTVSSMHGGWYFILYINTAMTKYKQYMTKIPVLFFSLQNHPGDAKTGEMMDIVYLLKSFRGISA
jgi:hypothetical protein